MIELEDCVYVHANKMKRKLNFERETENKIVNLLEIGEYKILTNF